MIFRCPGAQNFRQPEPKIVKCPLCYSEVEIWTDETKTTCPKCKKVITRSQATNCLDWCKYAKECAGEQVYNKYMQNKKKEMV